MNTRFLAAALLVLFAAGCASSDSQQAQQPQTDQNANASAIPWNRPQSWEGQGMLGGFDQPQGSTGH